MTGEPTSGGVVEYNIADLFESVVDVVPDREALVYIDHPGTGAERRLTYAELDAAANRIAHHLIDAGIRPGEHLGLHLYNGVEYLQTVLGCLKARVVPVNVNYRYVEEELVYLYRDADLVALVFDTEFTERVAAALPRAEQLRHLVRVGAPQAGRTGRTRRGLHGRGGHRVSRARVPGAVGGRPVHHLHRRYDRDAQGRDVAPGGPVLLGTRRWCADR
jgi:acyl-CoA synthetase (AMP-forming)/AMP-acid ligase II